MFRQIFTFISFFNVILQIPVFMESYFSQQTETEAINSDLQYKSFPIAGQIFFQVKLLAKYLYLKCQLLL